MYFAILAKIFHILYFYTKYPFHNVLTDECDGIFLLKQQSARLFTAKAHAHFHAAAELLIKAWVFAANLAQSIIAKL